MKAPIRDLTDEADIGSGEKSPGHHETEELIRQVGSSPGTPAEGAARETAEERTRDQGGKTGDGGA